MTHADVQFGGFQKYAAEREGKKFRKPSFNQILLPALLSSSSATKVNRMDMGGGFSCN
jgi:hypothetical protein